MYDIKNLKVDYTNIFCEENKWLLICNNSSGVSDIQWSTRTNNQNNWRQYRSALIFSSSCKCHFLKINQYIDLNAFIPVYYIAFSVFSSSTKSWSRYWSFLFHWRISGLMVRYWIPFLLVYSLLQSLVHVLGVFKHHGVYHLIFKWCLIFYRLTHIGVCIFRVWITSVSLK